LRYSTHDIGKGAEKLLKTTVCDRPQQNIITEIRRISGLTVFLCLAVFGCTPERETGVTSVQEQSVVSLADREKIRVIVDELQGIEGLSHKAFELVGQEIKGLATGEKKSLDLAALVDKAKIEVLATGSGMAAKSLPAGLPPGIGQSLKEAKEGMVRAGQLKAESLEVVKRFIEEKNPVILLEYRSKLAMASKQLDGAMAKLKQVQAAAGI
jgi:hypothetical protein